eukprot:1230471-Prymnesium_polylepis.2
MNAAFRSSAGRGASPALEEKGCARGAHARARGRRAVRRGGARGAGRRAPKPRFSSHKATQSTLHASIRSRSSATKARARAIRSRGAPTTGGMVGLQSGLLRPEGMAPPHLPSCSRAARARPRAPARPRRQPARAPRHPRWPRRW